MKFFRRIELSFRLGVFIQRNGWKRTRGRCPEGDRIFSREGDFACTNELVVRMVNDAGGSLKMLFGKELQAGGSSPS